MKKRPQGSASSASRLDRRNSGITVCDLNSYVTEYLFDCQYRNQSPRTLQEVTTALNKFLGYLQHSEVVECSPNDIRRYLISVAQGGLQHGGRWGQSAPKPVRPRTVRNHWAYLRTFFNWVSDEYPEIISPFERIDPPIVRQDQIRPFTAEQIAGLIAAAKRTTNPLRDLAIVLFLLDSGVRCSELCAIRIVDLDLGGHSCQVLGKGNKHRAVFFGRDTKKALWKYLQARGGVQDNEPLFMSARGLDAGEAFTRAGLQQLIERLGKAAKLTGVRCSPHTFRHTAAIQLVMNGCNAFTLQQLLGHTDLAMTQKYVNYAQADLQGQSRRFSPVDSLKVSRNSA